MLKKSVKIQLKNGLEARPVAVLVQVASQHESSVYIESDGKKVNAKQIFMKAAVVVIMVIIMKICVKN